MKKTIKIIGSILAIIVILSLGLRIISPSSTSESLTLLPRSVITIERQNLERTMGAIGNISPVQSKELSFPSSISGYRVNQVHISTGDFVMEGQILVELDNRQAQLDFFQAESELLRGQLNGTANEIARAKINYELAEEKLASTKLKAPFTGLVTNVLVEAGDYSSNTPVVSIIDNQFQILVNVEESKARDLAIGQAVNVSITALPNVTIRGKIDQIAPEATINSGMVTIPVTVVLEDNDFPVKSGYSAELEIITDSVENELVVPVTAVSSENGQNMVMRVIDDKTTEVIPVTTGLSDGLNIVIYGAIESGDQILVNTASSNYNPFLQGVNFNVNTGR